MTTSTATDPKTPGQAFVAAYREHGTRARVEFDTTITDQFPGFKRRPRIAMRALFKIIGTSEPQDERDRPWLRPESLSGAPNHQHGTQAVRCNLR